MAWTRGYRTVLFGSTFFLFSGAPRVCTAAPELITDRPDQTESSAVVPKGLFQMEVGGQFSRNDGIDGYQFPLTLLRLGIHDRTELRLGCEGGLWEKSYESGFGDSEVGTKISLWEESGWRPETAVLFGLTLPTGQMDFSTERFDPSLRFAMSNQLSDRFGLGYNVAIDWESFLEASADRDTRPSFAYSAALGIGLSRKISSFVEIFGRAPLYSTGTSRISFDGGVTYLLLGNLQLDMSTGAGLWSKALDWFVAAGIACRLPR